MLETPTSGLSPETASQAGAGALLFAVAAAELWLAFWDAGWWHRVGGCAIAIAGAFLLVRAISTTPIPVRLPTLRVPRRRAVSPPSAAARLALAE